MEESPVGDSRSNGAIESANRVGEEMIRVLKDTMDLRYKRKIPSDHPVIPWLVRHAGWLVSAFQVGPDGFTAI